MNFNDHYMGSGGVEDTTYKIDKYFRRIETIEMNLSERELSSEDRTALETELLELKRVLHEAQETVREMKTRSSLDSLSIQTLIVFLVLCLYGLYRVILIEHHD